MYLAAHATHVRYNKVMVNLKKTSGCIVHTQIIIACIARSACKMISSVIEECIMQTAWAGLSAAEKVAGQWVWNPA